MIISVVNHTNGAYADEDVQHAIRAINTQIARDFEPYWSMGALLRLEGKTGAKPDPHATEVRGDAVIYLWDKVQSDAALGYHDKTNRGLPYGFVFTDLAKRLGESWTVTLSHEALELIADPEANLLVKAPHPRDPKREAFFWYEMCDAVQDERYEVNGVEVSNFVLPLYFTSGDEHGGRNDFLGRVHAGKTLRSFGVNPGGYVGFYDRATGEPDTFLHPGQRAAEREQIKSAALAARRASRYRRRRSGG